MAKRTAGQAGSGGAATCVAGAAVGTGNCAMEGVLGGRESLADQSLRRVSRPVQQERQLLALGRGEITQHERGGVHPPRRPADAEPEPVVLTRPERGGHRAQPVMTVVTAALLEPYGAKRNIQLIVNHQQPPGGDPVVAAQPGHRPAGQVHEGQGLAEGDRLPGQPPLRDRRLELPGPEPGAGPGGQQVRHHVPGVVPVGGVARAGVAQPGDEPAFAGHAGAALPAQQARQAGREPQPDCPAGSWACPSGAAGAPAASSGAGGTSSASSAAGTSPSSASSCSAVGAASTCSTSASGSVTRVTPSGRVSSPAWTAAPISMPSTSTSNAPGMLVASASTATCTSCWSSRPPENTSPLTWTGTSTVTFSPRRTMIRSTCSTAPRIGWRWTALGRASWLPPGRPSMRMRTLGVFSAIIRAWLGRVMCRVSVPCP